MNAPHLHLILNHFPVIGTLFGILVLVSGFLLKNDWVKNTAYGIFIFTSVISIPVFFSGGQAEEAIEHLAGIDESYIEEHEEAAVWAICFIEALGILSLVTLLMWMKGKAFQKQLSLLTLLLSCFAFATVVRVNNLGGEIRHTEIRSNSSVPQQSGQEKEDKDENDD